MTRLERRNKTKRVKAWKKAGNLYRQGRWFKRYRFEPITVAVSFVAH